MKYLLLLLLSICNSNFVSAQTSQWQLSNSGSCNYFNFCFLESSDTILANGGCLSVDSGFTYSMSSNGIFAYCLEKNSAGIFAGSDTAIYFSNNIGTSWTNVHSTGPLNFVNGLAVLNDTIFAATRLSGILMSPDNGITWTQVNSGLPNDSAYSILAKGNLLFAGMIRSGIYISSNSGVSWTSLSSGLPTTGYVRSIATDGANVYATIGGTMYISSNNGTSWSQSSIPSTKVTIIAAVGNVMLAGGLNVSGTEGLFRSTDAGLTWSLFDNGLPNSCSYEVGAIYGTSSYVLCGIGESVCHSNEIYRISRSNVTTSVNDIADLSNNVFDIFPNPFCNSVRFQTNNNSPSEIRIYDITNRNLIQQKYTNSVTLNTESLAKGIYVYTVISEDGSSRSGKIVKE